MKYTDLFKFLLPDPEDFYSVSHMNQNTQLIEDELKSIKKDMFVFDEFKAKYADLYVARKSTTEDGGALWNEKLTKENVIYAERISKKTETGWRIETKCPVLSLNTVVVYNKSTDGWQAEITNGVNK